MVKSSGLCNLVAGVVEIMQGMPSKGVAWFAKRPGADSHVDGSNQRPDLENLTVQSRSPRKETICQKALAGMNETVETWLQQDFV